MPKQNVSFARPEDPSFLKKLKAAAGYKEGPSVETKREELEQFDEKDYEDIDEEQPTVVVLKSGDLTAEEAAKEKKKQELEAETTPADLTKPIVFKAKKRAIPEDKESKDRKKDSKRVKNKSLLSFDEEDEEN